MTMNNMDFYFNIINIFGYYAVLLWISGYIFIKKTLRFKGVNDPKSYVLLLIVQFLCYILLSITTKLFFKDLELWAEFFVIMSTVFIVLSPIILNLSLRRLNLRDKLKQPNKTNNILWTICEICMLILSISYVYALFVHANIHYNTSIAFNKYIFQMWSTCMKDTATWGAPLWLIMLLQAIRKHKLTKNHQTITSVTGTNPPIVYLRTFGLDRTPAINNKTFDEYLFNGLQNPIVISLADPNEIIPSGGSIKIQSHDESWKEVVKHLLQHARAVIIVLGDTEGLKWEIGQLKKFLIPSQLYIVIPPFYYASLAWCNYFGENKEILSEYGDNATKNISHIISLPLFYKRNLRNIHQLWTKFTNELNNEGLSVDGSFPGFNRVISFTTNWEQVCDKRKHNGKEILDFILANSETEKSCNYKELSKLVEKYEVNGFVPNNYVLYYRSVIKRIAGFYGFFCTLLLFLVIFLTVNGGVNVFTSKREFKDFMDSTTCVRAYLYCIKEKDQQAYDNLMSKSYFTLTVLNDSVPAFFQGMRGEYVLLEYADWTQDSLSSLWDKNEELRGKPKTILVLKDDSVMQYNFEDSIGARLYMKCEYEGKKKFINKKYEEWKVKNR